MTLKCIVPKPQGLIPRERRRAAATRDEEVRSACVLHVSELPQRSLVTMKVLARRATAYTHGSSHIR